MVVSTSTTILLAGFNGLAALVTFGMENPRNKYYNKIPDIKGNRLDDVHNALSPIVADVNKFTQDGEDGSIEKLTAEDQASIALADSTTPSDDFPELRQALDEYYEPPKVYRRCRRSRDGCYYSFVAGVILSILPVGFQRASLDGTLFDAISVGAYWVSAGTLIIGVIMFLSFMYHRSKLDKMTENADFQLD
ncbi:hypothetical protein [Halorubrum trapanicum]|uniref:hypothetical protein n=1 Tax=Halorubrum trapanicum TaxID=29284 RepID=UPI003C6F50B9